MFTGSVESIHIIPTGGADPVAVESVEAVPDQGLRGDRYGSGTGTFSKADKQAKQAITLIEAEALEALARDYGLTLAPGASRRNIVTRHVPLNHLVGREFRVGEVILRGVELCEPCDHLAKLTDPRALPGLIHRGGLRAEVLVGGMISVGDSVKA